MKRMEMIKPQSCVGSSTESASLRNCSKCCFLVEISITDVHHVRNQRTLDCGA